MDSKIYIQLLFLCVVNIIFTFFGIFSNTLVIVCFLKSSQLRKKLCNFMVMVLSCFDLLAVIANHPAFVLYVVFWLIEDYELFHMMGIYAHFATMFLGFSFFALLVMNIERYMAVYYPIFHRNSVTRRRLLTLLAVLLILHTTITIISANDLIIVQKVGFIIFMAIAFPPFMFLNYKLFKISRTIGRNNGICPEKRTTVNMKIISTCLFAGACLLILSIPSTFFVVFSFDEQSSMNNVRLSYIWAVTVCTMNSTFNSLIFFWKNNILRTEGLKILNTLKYRFFGN
jgi:hypothetical protein